jgi:hypothetical protein
MKVDIRSLQASSKTLKRDNLLWHVKNPGKRKRSSPFTTINGKPMPLVAQGFDGNLIIADGHHFLASGLILGFTTAQVMCLPTS